MSTVVFEPLDSPHATALHELWSDPEVVRYTNWERCSAAEESAERVERLRRRYAEEPRRLGPFVVRDGDGCLVGLIGVDWVDGEHELWYLVRREFWGRGFGSAMVARMLEAAGDRGFGRLVATAVDANVASWRLLERQGFEREATLVHGFRKPGVRGDLHRYARGVESRGGSRPPPVTWDDLVLPDQQLAQLRRIASRATIQPERRRSGQPPGEWPESRRVLFAGAPGTGKSLAAAVLAAALGRPLVRVDLGAIAGEYIGETEKNLDRSFADARRQGAVMLLDEADALFGRSGEATDARDRPASAVAGYLLQRIEEHRGLVILAANRRDRVEPAFLRRMAEVVRFPMPDRAAREAIWRMHLPGGPDEAALDHARLARMRIDGGTIRNSAARARLRALASEEPLTLSMVLEAAAAERSRRDGGRGPRRD